MVVVCVSCCTNGSVVMYGQRIGVCCGTVNSCQSPATSEVVMEVLKIWDWAMQDWTLVDEWAGMDNEGRH